MHLLLAQVICNGEEVLTTSGTKPEYTVEVWSGNHPFYQGSSGANAHVEGRVSAFNKRFQVWPLSVFDWNIID